MMISRVLTETIVVCSHRTSARIYSFPENVLNHDVIKPGYGVNSDEIPSARNCAFVVRSAFFFFIRKTTNLSRTLVCG